jgi:hypothetical protein
LFLGRMNFLGGISRRGRSAVVMCLAAGLGRMVGEMAGTRLDEGEKESHRHL